ncbi:hypothetical protein [Helicobacter cetorum]|uniref:Putative N-6 DNA methylase n=1 Tax=Helicobacter cetorum (strain ATCC BAA-540 / CCUG 52418 / MIT 99-5656) TaxID=1163745 RepID=I0ETR0_HELCM|nr:hypothetical protein [Helicobacter cetorum]AFI06329.1 putative N-6 DNA methylase [Helicobacter cetorum MIT 99-5656]
MHCSYHSKKNAQQNEFIHMAVAEYIGHDHNGRLIYDKQGNIKDETINILNEIKDKNLEKKYTFEIEAKQVVERDILIPRYYS